MRELDLITDALDRRRSPEADIRWRRYYQPYGDLGAHIIRPSFSSQLLVVSGPRRTFATGQTVPTGSRTGFLAEGEMILIEPPLQRRGGERFPEITSSATFGAAIESADPPTVNRGEDDQAVTVYGYGFRGDHNIEAVVEADTNSGWALDTLINIHDVVWVSSNEMTIEVDVSADAPVGYKISLALLGPGEEVEG